MTEKELLKLKRSEMLEIMLAQSREIDDLRKELEETKAALEDRKIKVRKAGSLAEASLQLLRTCTWRILSGERSSGKPHSTERRREKLLQQEMR